MHLQQMYYTLQYILYFVLVALVAAGSNGQVRSDYNKNVQLTSSEIQQYPIALLKLMSRYAEDLIFTNKIGEGGDVFKFVITLASNRKEASEISKG